MKRVKPENPFSTFAIESVINSESWRVWYNFFLRNKQLNYKILMFLFFGNIFSEPILFNWYEIRPGYGPE